MELSFIFFLLHIPVFLLGQKSRFRCGYNLMIPMDSVLLVKAAAACFYMSCKSHRYWIYSQLLGPLAVTRLRFHWSLDFPAAEVDIVPCKGELGAETGGLVTCQSGSGMPKGLHFLIALCHPSSWAKGNFNSLSCWDGCWVVSALHVN